MTISELKTGIFIRQSRFFYTNSGILTRGQDALLIDPGISLEEREELRSFLREQGWKVKFVLLTHSHWDHILGAGDYPEAEVVTQSNFPMLLEEHLPETRRIITDWERDNGVRPGLWHPPRPAICFSQRLNSFLPEGTVCLLASPGHTSDQYSIYLPEQKTLWAADMLSDREIPYAEFSIKEYLRTLRQLRDLPVETLIPGHGSPVQDAREACRRFAEDIAYLEELASRVAESVKAGRTCAETLRACAEIPVKDPKTNLEGHRRNVESGYKEFGGQPSPDYPGWKKETGWKDS